MDLGACPATSPMWSGMVCASFLFERVECSAAIAARDAISPREGAGHDADLIVTGAAAGPTLIAVVEQSKRGGVVES